MDQVIVLLICQCIQYGLNTKFTQKGPDLLWTY